MDETETTPAPMVVLDLRTLTLGELAAVEDASGRSFETLWRGKAGRLLVALYVSELRRVRASPSSAPMPSWSELSDRPLLDVSS